MKCKQASVSIITLLLDMMHIYPATFCTAFGHPVLVWVTNGEWAKQGAIAIAAPVYEFSQG